VLEDEEQETVGVSRRDDLLKMHAYRDAIRRSAGAYVLFPGTSAPHSFREFVELIPGLGAFPLRPGDDSGTVALRRFIDDVLLHAADQATAEERRRFWQARIFAGPSGSDRAAVSFLDRPPADSPVLISWVPDERRWQWTDETEQYVLQLPGGEEGIAFRAEELAAQLILLSGAGRSVIFERRGAWTILDEDDLRVLRYPSLSIRPGLLCRLIPIDHQPGWLDEVPAVDLLARAPTAGAPVLVSWSDLVRRKDQAPLEAATVQRRVPKPGRDLGLQRLEDDPGEATVDKPGEPVPGE